MKISLRCSSCDVPANLAQFPNKKYNEIHPLEQAQFRADWQTEGHVEVHSFFFKLVWERAWKKMEIAFPHPIPCRSLSREEPAHKQWALSLCTCRIWTNLIKSRCHLNLKCRIIWKGLEKGLQAYVVWKTLFLSASPCCSKSDINRSWYSYCISCVFNCILWSGILYVKEKISGPIGSKHFTKLNWSSFFFM